LLQENPRAPVALAGALKHRTLQPSSGRQAQQAGEAEQTGFTQAAASAGRLTWARATRARENRNRPNFFMRDSFAIRDPKGRQFRMILKERIVKPCPITEPFSKAEILRDLEAVRDWSLGFWRQFETTAFFAPLGEAWSPADNVRHLVKSNRPVALAMGLPRLVLYFRFGISRRRSRGYSDLRSTYREALGTGLTAGRFAASPVAVGEQTVEGQERALRHLAGPALEICHGDRGRQSPGPLPPLSRIFLL
jgi:hypothetical protein